MTQTPRDHGGGIDAARRKYGGCRIAWADLSTGINPVPFTPRPVRLDDWTALPDTQAMATLTGHARRFWRVPAQADIVAAPGASALIAQIPGLAAAGKVHVPQPTYN
ncbi:MAG: threonine-phosphate decarboxylase, partial [Roseobacter sp.]|nr:threonine-phosphate decarboxylase [Roseobacter sp.]